VQRAMMTTLIVGVLVATLGCGLRVNPARDWNVILISIDTLRADRLGCYGNNSIRTPNIDRFAEQTLRFERCFSAAPITLPSHTTMLTGMYPPRHSVRDNGTFTVPTDIPTLATILSSRGYDTAGVIGAYPIHSDFGLHRGFRHWDEDFEAERTNVLQVFFDERPAEQVARRAGHLLESRLEEPYFLFAHFFDVHQPWKAPEPYASLYRTMPYDAEIAYVDTWIGHILRSLEASGTADRTIVVLTADHGEGLLDHEEFSHSILLYNETMRVPLLVSIPGREAGVVSHPVSLVDLAPTILEVIGLEAPEPMDGRSLLAEPDPERAIYMESLSGRLGHGWNEMRAWVDTSGKMILGAPSQLFDVDRDLRERRDLAPTNPDTVDRSTASMFDFVVSNVDRHRLEDRFTIASDETADRLRALGYLSGDAPTDAVGSEVEPLRPDGDPRQHIGVLNAMSISTSQINGGQPLRAISTLQLALDRHPGDAELLKKLLVAQILVEQYDDAKATLRRIPDNAAEHGSVILMAAVIERADGNIDQAVSLARQALDSAGVRSATLFLAETLESAGRFDDAIAMLDDGIAQEPCDRVLLKERANLAVRMSDRAGIRAAYAAMLDCAPYDTLALFNLGNAMLEDGELDRAETYYQRAIRFNSDYLPGHYGLALVLLETGDAEAAVPHLKKVRDEAPPGSSFHASSSQILQQIGVPE
jgi:arylsulfatase A-like enzyme/tetratricopeptide (TPR) repeat protein